MPRILFLACLLLFGLTGCGGLFVLGLEPNAVRAALDECREFNLNTLVYSRADGSVFAIRCIPKPDDITKNITIRPRVPLRLLRPYFDTDYLTAPLPPVTN